MKRLIFVFLWACLFAFVISEETDNDFDINTNIQTFSAQCLKNIYYGRNDSNTLVFALPAYILLGLTVMGASGETADGIWNSLDIHSVSEQQAFEQEMSGLVQRLKNHTLIEYYSKIFMIDGNVREDFLKFAQDEFKCETQELNINDPDNWNVMIEWVRHKLHNNSTNQVDSVLMYPNDYLVVNTFFFNAEWSQKFDPNDTTLSVFYTSPDAFNLVDMMHLEGDMDYINTTYAQVVYLRFKDSDMYTMLMLPHEINPTLDVFRETVHELRSTSEGEVRRVKLALPKFSVSSNLRLKDMLPEMGPKSMFTTDADFSLMFNSSNHVDVDTAMTYAVVEFNEWGTGSAPNEFVLDVVPSQEPDVEFIADHIFYFAIFDGAMTICEGYVTNPPQI